MDDLIAWLRAQIDEDERRALLALRGYAGPDDDPSNMRSYDRTARWWSDYHRVQLVRTEPPPPGVTETDEQLATVHHANYPAAAHIAQWQPSRVLAECEAKRAFIAMHPPGPLHDTLDGPSRLCQGHDFVEFPCTMLKLLVELYAKLGRPGYQESWRP